MKTYRFRLQFGFLMQWAAAN